MTVYLSLQTGANRMGNKFKGSAEIIPVETSLSYPFFSIVGKVKTPIVTTVAPTIPVAPASMAPTIKTEKANLNN